jgi:hypothetical protein
MVGALGKCCLAYRLGEERLTKRWRKVRNDGSSSTMNTTDGSSLIGPHRQRGG